MIAHARHATRQATIAIPVTQFCGFVSDIIGEKVIKLEVYKAMWMPRVTSALKRLGHYIFLLIAL